MMIFNEYLSTLPEAYALDENSISDNLNGKSNQL